VTFVKFSAKISCCPLNQQEGFMMDVKSAVSMFLRHCRLERGLSELTMSAYELDLNQFVEGKNKMDCMSIVGITKETIREYLDFLGDKYKPRSVRRKVATLKSFFTFLEQEEVIITSPFRKLRVKVGRAKHLPRVMSISSITSLLHSAYMCKEKYRIGCRVHWEVTRDIAVLEMLFSTGVRVSELCNLQKSDVNLKQKQILVLGKGKRERVIPLCCDDTITALKDYEKCYESYLSEDGNFFLNRDKRPLSDQSVRQIIKKYQVKACIPEEVTPHMFRHTIATLMLENGVDIRNIQALLGHSSLAVTEIYTHVSLSAQREALGRSHPRSALRMEETHR
jgi:integrase/recombinase XerD